MTKIYNMSAGFMLTYMTCQDEKNLDLEKVFKRLSFEMGGDGKTITKEQIDDYIKKADKGLIKVDKSKLKAIKQIQKNWETVAGGDDTLTFEEIKKYSTLLMATLTGNFEVMEVEDSDSKDSIYDFLMECLDLPNKESITKDDLTAFLNKILSENPLLEALDGEDDEVSSEDYFGFTSNIVDSITNMIADFSSVSTIEKVA